MFTFFTKLFKDESGQGMVEYGLILALVAIGVILALTFLGEEISAIFESITDALRGTGGE